MGKVACFGPARRKAPAKKSAYGQRKQPDYLGAGQGVMPFNSEDDLDSDGEATQSAFEASQNDDDSDDESSSSDDFSDDEAPKEGKAAAARTVSKKPMKTGNYIAGKIDSGCTTTILSQRTLNKLIAAQQHCVGDTCSVTSKGTKGSTYKFADGLQRTAKDQVTIKSEINGEEAEVFANVFGEARTPFLLGLNFLRAHEITITFKKDADVVRCAKLNLNGDRLPRDSSGLSIMPFCADYQAVLASREKRNSS